MTLILEKDFLGDKMSYLLGVEAKGTIGHDIADTTTTFPVKIGLRAKNQDGTTPNSVIENDRVNAICDRAGAKYVSTISPFFFQTATSFTGATTNSLLINPMTGSSIFLTSIYLNGGGGSVISLYKGTNTALIIQNTFRSSDRNFQIDFTVPYHIPLDTTITVETTASLFNIYMAGFYL